MYTYKIVTLNEGDSMETIVSKSGLVSEFSLKQVYDHKLKLEQEIKEKEAKIALCEATKENITINHEDIKEIIDDIKARDNANGVFATLFLWIKEDIERDNNQRMVDERKKVLEEYEEELNTIHESLSIPKPIKIAFTKANKEENE